MKQIKSNENLKTKLKNLNRKTKEAKEKATLLFIVKKKQRNDIQNILQQNV